MHRRAVVTEAEGKKEATITVAEGDKQSVILRAEGEEQGRILAAEGYSLALGKIYEAAKGIDAKTMSLQYLDTLKMLGSGPATKFIFLVVHPRLARRRTRETGNLRTISADTMMRSSRVFVMQNRFRYLVRVRPRARSKNVLRVKNSVGASLVLKQLTR
jgi:hypothetical protein